MYTSFYEDYTIGSKSNVFWGSLTTDFSQKKILCSLGMKFALHLEVDMFVFMNEQDEAFAAAMRKRKEDR